MAFNEAKLEQAILDLLGEQGYPHVLGAAIAREPQDVLIRADLESYLRNRYAPEGITPGEIRSVIQQLESYSSLDLYDSNKAIMKMVSDGFLLKREDHKKKDLYIQLLDYSHLPEVRRPPDDQLITVDNETVARASPPYVVNIIKVVSQLEIVGSEKRIHIAILYINGLPLVVFKFKSAVREELNVHEAYKQITTRYKRDIPELFKYNAFCVISDGANSKMGSFFAPYEFYYAWRRIEDHEDAEVKGIDSLHTLLQGLFHPHRLLEVIRHFIYFPDKSHKEEKILCRYPQYYAATKLYANILQHRRPEGDGKGGTYFGATGCGKSYTMLCLTR